MAGPWVVAQHTPTEGPGLLSAVFVDVGVDHTAVRLDLGEALPDLGGVGGVVVMGGPMSVRDPLPWLEDERRWLARAVQAGTGVLGVCLGAQQLAAALGARVTAGPAPEIGVGTVELTDDGLADPVLGPEGRRLPVVHWHGDTFDVPRGAVLLASSERYARQAFRVGALAYGLQFHLEVDDGLAASWAPELPPGVDFDAARRAPVEEVGRRVLRRFVDLVRGTGGSPAVRAS